MATSPTRQWFIERGTTIGDWASRNEFSKDLVYGVLSGRIKGTRGQAYEIRKKLIEAQTRPVSESEQIKS